MFVCPVTGGLLSEGRSPEGRSYPSLDGIPVLISDPDRFLARYGPGAWDSGHGLPTRRVEDMPIDAADPVTPHLPPSALGGVGSFGRWLGSLGERCPDQVCATWGTDLAPNGRSLDVGCGVAPMARRMAAAGRNTYAFDHAPRAVLLARDLLTGRLKDSAVPTSRSGLQKVRWPFNPLPERMLHFFVADAAAPPLPAGGFAWVHLGAVLDIADDSAGDILSACCSLLQPGGIMTITTPYNTDDVGVVGATAPEEELREALGAMGVSIVEEETHVPWVVREYDRSFRVLFCHCVAVRRPAR